MSSSRIFKYFAFISYSRKDIKFAEKLHRYLSYFKLPGKLCLKYPLMPKNVRPIYRDKTDLIIDNKLDETLKYRLEVSKYLIVICSENSAQTNEEGKNWIDEEVRTFLSLDPENVHRIIPVLLRDENQKDVKACMPSAIRELGLLAADVVDKGRERVFSDVIAKMLDLEPDELLDWVEREQRRRRVIARVGIGAVSCLLACGALFAWDFCRLKVHYFQDYVEYNNVPVGIHELTKEQTEKLQFHYRFTEQYYKVQSVETCNSAGKLSDAKYTWAPQRPVKLKLEYDYLEGWAKSCDYLDKSGRVVASLKYPDDELIRFVRKDDKEKEQGSDIAVERISKKMGLNLANTEIARRAKINLMKVERDSCGRMVKEMFQTSDGVECKNAEGVFGYLYERDEITGQVLKLRYLSNCGEVVSTQKGIAGYDIEYNDEGLATKLTYVNEEGNPAVNENGYSKEIYQWENKNHVQTSYADAQGNPCLTKFSIASEVYEYNEKGNIVKSITYGLDGLPCLHKDGYAGILFEYDTHGNEVKRVYLGVDGLPCLHKDGCAGILSEYDPHGNEVKRVYLGVDGQPCLHKDGYAGVLSEYDVHGSVVKRVYLGVDGLPCLHKDGYAGVLSEYNAQGNEVKRVYLGVDGQPCQHKSEPKQQ